MQLFKQLPRFLDPAQSVVTPCYYACMYMWLCTFMLCYQLLTMHAIYATGKVISVIPRSSSVSYANSLWLCLHVHVTMHIYAMWSVSDYACYLCNWPRFCYAGRLWHLVYGDGVKIRSSPLITWLSLTMTGSSLSAFWSSPIRTSSRAAVELDHLHNLSVKIGSKHPCAVIVC